MYLITATPVFPPGEITNEDWSASSMHLVRDQDARDEKAALEYFHKHVRITPENFNITCEVVDWTDERTDQAMDVIPF